MRRKSYDRFGSFPWSKAQTRLSSSPVFPSRTAISAELSLPFSGLSYSVVKVAARLSISQASPPLGRQSRLSFPPRRIVAVVVMPWPSIPPSTVRRETSSLLTCHCHACRVPVIAVLPTLVFPTAVLSTSQKAGLVSVRSSCYTKILGNGKKKKIVKVRKRRTKDKSEGIRERRGGREGWRKRRRENLFDAEYLFFYLISPVSCFASPSRSSI